MTKHADMSGPALALAALMLAISGNARAAGDCSEGIDARAEVLANGFAADGRNTRNFVSDIDASNVASLQPAFVHVAEESTEKRGAPAVTEQAIFLSAGRDIVAIDRITGCQYWSYRIPQRLQTVLQDNAVRSSAVYYLEARGEQPPLVFAGDTFGHFYALDARDGRLVWSRFLGTAPRHHWITGAPQEYGGVLIVPVSSKEVLSGILGLLGICCTSHGLVRAVDVYTGDIVWTFHTTEDARFHLSSRQLAPSGATVWGTPAVDPQRERVYFGTGQNLSHPSTGTASAIIAVGLHDGALRWVFQPEPDDVWNVNCEVAPVLSPGCVEPIGPDHDFGAPPILVQRAGHSDLLLAGGKSGVVYALDPDSGNPLWSRRIGTGGTLGGIHWGMAVDEQRVYAAVSDATVRKAQALDLGLISLGLENRVEPVSGARSGIYALDLDSGEQAWARFPRHEYEGSEYDSIHSAAVSVTNDLLLIGSLDGVVRALHTDDGRELWRFDSAIPVEGINGVAGNGGEIGSVGPIVAERDILLNSGYDTFGSPSAYQAGPGNALFVFRLP